MAGAEDTADYYFTGPACAGADRLPAEPMRIHQVLVAAAPGDAITNAALETQELLVGTGMPSHLFARYIDPALSGRVKALDEFPAVAGGHEDTVILYHGSIGEASVTRFLQGRPERLVIVYHNMSPAKPFAPYDPGFATLLDQGRRELRSLRERTVLALADSAFNAADLEALGFHDVAVSPLIIEPRRLLTVVPHPETVRWQRAIEGKVLLFVGQLLPHKQPHVLLQAFHVLVTYLLPEAHLFLIGAPRLPRYKEALQTYIEELNLTHCGIIRSPVSQEELAAYYRRADAFVTLSEHEGFCVPLIEAMAFGKPIVARGTAAIPETVGDAALLIGEQDGTLVAAEAMYEILTNEPLRADLVARGHRRVEHYSPDRSRALLLEHLKGMKLGC
ncbi:MAG: glycosyltransferase family 4 protein [Actinomycetota bacterium]